MANENQTWFIDFSEKGQMWHIDLERVPENDSWVNIGYGRYEVLSYFCDMVDVLTTEFKMHLTPEQVLRLAECTPGLTVYQNTDVPEDEFDSDVHMRPIYARETLEKRKYPIKDDLYFWFQVGGNLFKLAKVGSS